MHNLEGQRFGRLVVIRRDHDSTWMCQCDCGKISFVITSNLRKGNSKSCGCARDEARTKHGLCDTPEYKIWQGMRSRCNSRNDGAYRNYGGRGISVCPEWDDFIIFLKEMGTRPGPGYELDRIDNEKGYSKGNCHWTTSQINENNRRNNRRVEYRGKTQTIAEWAAQYGFNYRTLNNRINRGWSVERALTESIRKGT